MLVNIPLIPLLQHLNDQCIGANGLTKQLMSIDPSAWIANVEVPNTFRSEKLADFKTGGYFPLSYAPDWFSRVITDKLSKSSGTIFTQDLWLNSKLLSPFYRGEKQEIFDQLGSAYFWISSNNFSMERANRIASSTRSFQQIGALSTFELEDSHFDDNLGLQVGIFENLLSDVVEYFIEVYDGESYAILSKKSSLD